MAIPCKRPDQNAATTLPAVASASAPSYEEGDAVPLSVTLAGTLRSTAGSGGGTGDASEAQQILQTALLTTIDADTDAIKTALQILDNAISGSEMQVDVLTMPSVAVTGTFWQATQPVSIVPTTPSAPYTSNFTASGDTVAIAAPGASTYLYLCKGSVHNRHASNVTVSLRDGAAGTVYWRAELAAEGGGSLFDFGARGWKLTANTALYVNLSGASDIDLNVTEYYAGA